MTGLVFMLAHVYETAAEAKNYIQSNGLGNVSGAMICARSYVSGDAGNQCQAYKSSHDAPLVTGRNMSRAKLFGWYMLLEVNTLRNSILEQKTSPRILLNTLSKY